MELVLRYGQSKKWLSKLDRVISPVCMRIADPFVAYLFLSSTDARRGLCGVRAVQILKEGPRALCGHSGFCEPFFWRKRGHFSGWRNPLRVRAVIAMP